MLMIWTHWTRAAASGSVLLPELLPLAAPELLPFVAPELLLFPPPPPLPELLLLPTPPPLPELLPFPAPLPLPLPEDVLLPPPMEPLLLELLSEPLPDPDVPPNPPPPLPPPDELFAPDAAESGAPPSSPNTDQGAVVGPSHPEASPRVSRPPATVPIETHETMQSLRPSPRVCHGAKARTNENARRSCECRQDCARSTTTGANADLWGRCIRRNNSR
jgi:hypothetical protein